MEEVEELWTESSIATLSEKIVVPLVVAPHWLCQLVEIVNTIRASAPEKVQALPGSARFRVDRVTEERRAGHWPELPPISAEDNVDATEHAIRTIYSTLVRGSQPDHFSYFVLKRGEKFRGYHANFINENEG